MVAILKVKNNIQIVWLNDSKTDLIKIIITKNTSTPMEAVIAIPILFNIKYKIIPIGINISSSGSNDNIITTILTIAISIFISPIIKLLTKLVLNIT